MIDQITELNQLLKKYRAEAEDLEGKLKEKKEKINVLYEAMKLLEQERKLQPSLTTVSADSSISDKYKDMTLNNAIFDVLANSDKYLEGNDVFNELMKNGYKSESSNIKRDVFIALYRLAKEGKISSKKLENRKKYMIKDDTQD